MALQNQEIGERIRALREDRGNPPQTVVADALGVSERTYQTWEYGEAKPSYRSLQKLAAYFQVGEDFILTGTERATPDPFAGQPTDLTHQLERIERSLADIAQRDDQGQRDRDTIKALLAQQSRILQDISSLLGRQEEILKDMQRVARGLPGDEALRLLNEGAQRIWDASQAGQVARDEPSSGRGGSRRRAQGDR